MSEQEKLANRIKTLCSAKDMSYYTLSYRSAVPMTTLMHIIDCSTQNPGDFYNLQAVRRTWYYIKRVFRFTRIPGN